MKNAELLVSAPSSVQRTTLIHPRQGKERIIPRFHDSISTVYRRCHGTADSNMVTAGPWPRLATIPDDFPALLSETNWTMRLARIFLLCPLIDWVSVLVRCALPYRALPTVDAWARPGTSCGIACGSLVSGSRSSRRGFRGLSGGGRTKNRYELDCTLPRYTAPLYGVQPGIW